MDYTHWRQADTVEVNFRGHKGDQAQKGNVRVLTRDETSGPRAGYRADGGAVALLVELLSHVMRRCPLTRHYPHTVAVAKYR